jgi:aarF domain-containing kinase
MQRTKRAIEFYKRVLPVLAAYKAKELEFKLKKTPEEEQQQAWQELDEWGSTRIAETIHDMKGFYVKTGQVISTRVDLFPEAYTSKLQELQDSIEPMPFDLVEKVVSQELLDGAPLSELFSSFDKEPLGSASIAQVHKATLLDGRVVAVKLQRPNVEPKLLGDVANLKRISKALAKSLPVDYYTVFCELGDALVNELDFLAEAQAMRKIDFAVSHDTDGSPTERPVSIPLPVGELVSKRVLVMDFVEGVPLNRLQETLQERGIEPGSPESKIAGRRILDSLSLAFGRMIFGAGFIHGDPHPYVYSTIVAVCSLCEMRTN